MRFRHIFLALLLVATGTRAADTIDGVQPAALDQPRIYVHLLRTPKGPPLAPPEKPVTANDPLSQLLGDQPADQIEAFLDTGASGVVLSRDTADALGVHHLPAVTFRDVGVGGTEKFDVSEPVFLTVAPYPNPTTELPPIGPISAQLRGGGGILEALSPGLDIIGTPAMRGRAIVIDPTGLSKYELMNTSLVDANSNVPTTHWHVPLNEVSFSAFTQVSPKGAAGPTSAANPMIGPSPLDALDRHPAVRVTLHGKTVTGTFLLDTGAATSMISLAKARQLGVALDTDGNVTSEIPAGAVANDKFSLAVGGLGGMKQSSGIHFDTMSLPTREGPPIIFTHAPLLIADISMSDASGKTITLDGVLGMNYLVASAELTGGLLPDIGKIVDGPWKRIVIDLKRDELGLEPN